MQSWPWLTCQVPMTRRPIVTIFTVPSLMYRSEKCALSVISIPPTLTLISASGSLRKISVAFAYNVAAATQPKHEKTCAYCSLKSPQI